MKLTLKTVAEYIRIGLIKNRFEFEERVKGQWEYKKNKGFMDIKIALEKGIKMGRGKKEREIECIEMYLEMVLQRGKKAVKYCLNN